MLSLEAEDVARALVGIGRELDKDSVLTDSVGGAYEDDNDVVALIAGTSVNSGAMAETMDVTLTTSVLAGSAEDGENVDVGARTSVSGASVTLGIAVETSTAGTSVILGTAVELTSVALAMSVLLSLSGVSEATVLDTIALELDSVSTGTAASVDDGDIVVEVGFNEGTSVTPGTSVDSIKVTLVVALSSKAEVVEKRTLDDSVLFTKTEDVTGKVDSEEEAFTIGAGVNLGTSPEIVAVAFAVGVG